ncbi:YtfJ family protein [Photobacterium sp. 1_MG-2023]|uniref:YtfJ family protein n=1 Tax=Photobacterium sp. 1_MG-2023 TaxID=3062646 RepID=UPI0026E1318B|nr:YtfJ family protein [Photobacterium sp. 1_MG-2023]MDO6707667.1 YtfJ family protein [Photobacterium sp. 1_MG-2023]
MKSSLIALCTLLPAMAFQTSAHNLTLGQPLPSTSVSDKGELILQGDNIVYQTWQSSQLTGKVRVIQAIAGRSSAKELNASLIEAIKAANLPQDQYQTTTIINQDDAIWGTGGFVKSSAEDSKKEFAWSSIVLDAKGQVRSRWELKEESSAIIVLDQSGKVVFVKDGQLNQSEIQQAMSKIQALL